MKNKGSLRLIRRLGLALAVTAVLAPSAQASPVPPDPPDSPSIQSGVSASRQYLIRMQRQTAGPRAYIRRSARAGTPRRPIGGWE